MTFTDAPASVSGKWPLSQGDAFTIQIKTKEPNQSPYDVVNAYYARLTDRQKQNCEINNVDEPLEYYSDGALTGKPINAGDPHPTQDALGCEDKEKVASKN